MSPVSMSGASKSKASKSRGLWLALSSLMALLVSFSAFAQRSDGGISGDAQPGDHVVVQHTGTGFKREINADEDGNYRFRSVPLGEYKVTVTRGEGEVVLNALVNVRPGGTARPPKAAVRDGSNGEAPASAEPAPASN